MTIPMNFGSYLAPPVHGIKILKPIKGFSLTVCNSNPKRKLNYKQIIKYNSYKQFNY